MTTQEKEAIQDRYAREDRLTNLAQSVTRYAPQDWFSCSDERHDWITEWVADYAQAYEFSDQDRDFFREAVEELV